MAKLWRKLKWLVFFWDTVYTGVQMSSPARRSVPHVDDHSGFGSPCTLLFGLGMSGGPGCAILCDKLRCELVSLLQAQRE